MPSLQLSHPRALALVGVTLGVALGAASVVVADTAPPVITVVAPVEGAEFDQQLRLAASATDPDGLGRITFEADGIPIRSFTENLANGKQVAFDWLGAKRLTLGEHTITVVALDRGGSNAVTGGENTALASVKVLRVDAETLPRVATTVPIALTGTGLRRTVSGTVRGAESDLSRRSFPLRGKALVTWQVFSKGRFKTRHKGSSENIAPYRFRQSLARKGRWRVRVTFDAEAPYRASTSSTVTFAVR